MCSVKELLSLSIWLVVFEQTPMEMSDSFKTFILAALAAADRIHKHPPSPEIMQKYDFSVGLDAVYELAAANACKQLGLDSSTAQLVQSLKNATLARREILMTALTQPVDNLDKIIASYGS